MKHLQPSPSPHSPAPPPSRLPHVDARGCRDLWGAVLLAALRDLAAPESSLDRRQSAERWVGPWPGRDFRTVCTMAGLDPRRVHRAMRDLMALPPPERRAYLDRQERPKAGPQGSASPGPEARRARVAEMFADGVAPSDMPGRFAADSHAVSMGTIWNDLKHLRAKKMIGYARDPRPANRQTASRIEGRTGP